MLRATRHRFAYSVGGRVDAQPEGMMKRSFDELAQNLASGMSRREALSRFVTGVGAALSGGVHGPVAFVARPQRLRGVVQSDRTD